MQPVSNSEKLRRGVALHRQGDLVNARRIYAEILQQDPNDFDALHLAGVAEAQVGSAPAAVALLQRAVELEAGNAIVRTNLALAFHAAGQREAALASLDVAIALDPSFADAHYNRGNLLMELGRYERSVHAYDQALSLNPRSALAYTNRGRAQEALDLTDLALQSHRQATATDAGCAIAHLNLANLLARLDRRDEAMAGYERALVCDRQLGDAHRGRAALLWRCGRLEDALLGYVAAAAAMPTDGSVRTERGNLSLVLGRLTDALQSFDEALAIEPESVEAHNGRGIALIRLGRVSEALPSLDRAIMLNGEYAEAHFNRSCALLAIGNYHRGWREHEWRWRASNTTSIAERRSFEEPLWLGAESLSGKTILLHAEQGLGDTLQFCRYVPRVAQLGAQVIVEVQPPLAGVLAGLAGASRIVPRGEPLPSFDFQCPMMSLPLAFETTLESIPQATGYLAADRSRVEAWRMQLGVKASARVGLAWRGSPTNGNDRQRSIRLADLVSHLPREYRYFGLHKDVDEEERAVLASNPWVSNLAADFSDTAAICACLDLIITVDTSIAHLCGALGLRTWVLLCHAADWRWLLHRNDSPWYPSIRLYRQVSAGDWPEVFGRVRTDLVRELR
jgi:tetratricopeptide (TPR) repeat protein